MTVSAPKKTDPKATRQSPSANHALGAYLGVAIGDALGATVEFMTPGEIQAKLGQHRDIIGGGWLGLQPGQVTDDTEMSLALGRSLLAEKGIQATSIANHFSDWMATKPRDIGHTVRRGLVEFRRTGRPAQPMNLDAAGNGACMRIVPLVIATLGAPWRMVRQALHIQNHITHNAPLSDAGTETVAHMVQAGVLGQVDFKGLLTIAETLAMEHTEFAFGGRAESNPSGYIVDTLKAVFQGLAATDCFEDCLVDVVNRGGDADTTGAIAGMIAGAFYGADAIPGRWIKALDDEVADQCRQQTDDLLALSQKLYG